MYRMGSMLVRRHIRLILQDIRCTTMLRVRIWLFVVSTRVDFLTGGKKKHQIIEKKKLSDDTFEITCALDGLDQYLGLPVPQHVKLSMPGHLLPQPEKKGYWNGKELDLTQEVSRKYTPVSVDNGSGTVRYVIKAYKKCEKFPDGGLVGRALDQLKVGDYIDVEGPVGMFEYIKGGGFKFISKKMIAWDVKNLVLIGGGSGITPLYQLILAICQEGRDINIGLLYGNQTENDILLKNEIDELASKYRNFNVHYMVDKHEDPSQFEGTVGYITKDVVNKYTPIVLSDKNSCLVYFCGPPGMKSATSNILNEMAYEGLKVPENL